MPLIGFEEHLSGLRNVIELALSSEFSHVPTLVFASTIGIFRNVDVGFTVDESRLDNLALAVGQGYAEVKAVAERILENAAEQTPLSPTIVRFSSISGGCDGAWNTSTWFPALIKSSIEMKALPEIPGVASFVPAELAAQVLNEIKDAQLPFLLVAHPNPVNFMDIIEFFGQELGLPIVPYELWLQKLEDYESIASPADFLRIPALCLLDFFRDRKAGVMGTKPKSLDVEKLGLPSLRNDNCMILSPALANARSIGRSDAKQWLFLLEKSWVHPVIHAAYIA